MSTITNNRGKVYTDKGYTVRHQDDVYSQVKPYSTWQGYVLVGILAAIAYVLIAYVLPYLH